jgi:hypothetical protein
VIHDAAAGESGCTRMLSALGRLAGAAGQWRGQMACGFSGKRDAHPTWPR